MHKDIRNIVVDLVLDHNRPDLSLTGFGPHVNDNDQPKFRHYLTGVVTNKATLRRHQDALTELKATNPALPPGLLRKALMRGLNALDGHELALLSLNGSALISLAHAVENEGGKAWGKKPQNVPQEA
jgi:hypothetical protein